ncbi:MAG: alpha/beta hydrolase [Candidatus Limnocylindria bacterium]
MEHIEVSGLDIAFRRAGHGPALVLLHGGMCDSRIWRPQLESLVDEFTVVAWDAPGCGGSSDPPDSYRLPDYADCLAGLIDALGLDRPHVLGHSFGAGLALALYGRRPTLPRSLVVVAGYAGWAGSLPAEEVQARLELAIRLASELPKPVTPDSLPGLFASAPPAGHLAELAAVMSDVRAVGTRVMAHAFADADLRDLLPQITVPTLILHGDADERAPRAVWERLHADIPDSALVLLSGVGHEVVIEAPDAFDTEVRRFLANVP